jgi:hypothetical protein
MVCDGDQPGLKGPLSGSILLQVAGQPAMGIGGVEEVELAELEPAQGSGNGVGRRRLGGERRREERQPQQEQHQGGKGEAMGMTFRGRCL